MWGHCGLGMGLHMNTIRGVRACVGSHTKAEERACTHTHAHPSTHIHTQTHTHSHSQSHAPMSPYTQAHAVTSPDSTTNSYTHPYMCTPRPNHSPTHPHTHTHREREREREKQRDTRHPNTHRQIWAHPPGSIWWRVASVWLSWEEARRTCVRAFLSHKTTAGRNQGSAAPLVSDGSGGEDGVRLFGGWELSERRTWISAGRRKGHPKEPPNGRRLLQMKSQTCMCKIMIRES